MRIAILVTALLLAQAVPPRQFDVASVKATTSRQGTTRRDEPQGMTYLNITLGEFIRLAYGVQSYQIDGPAWITNNGSSTRFDIMAKAAAPLTERERRRARDTACRTLPPEAASRDTYAAGVLARHRQRRTEVQGRRRGRIACGTRSGDWRRPVRQLPDVGARGGAFSHA